MTVSEEEKNRGLPQTAITASEVYTIFGGDDNGGPEAFALLADEFYARVEQDAVLLPLYESRDLGDAREHLALFLMQYFGGPALYAEKRGHPRLRMRHFPYAIGPAERDAWLQHMNAAIDAVPALAPVAETLRVYFVNAAHFLQNRE